jgi:transcriptional regulator with XRE-family HTH domain
MIVATQHQVEAPSGNNPPQHPSLEEGTVDVLVKLEESSPLSEQLGALTKDIGIRDTELAALAGVSRATLARWRNEGNAERPRPLDDLRAIVVLLLRTGAMRPRSVAGWLRSRNFGLDWNRPLDVLRADPENFPLVRSAAEAACGGRVPVKKIPKLGNSGEPPGSTRASATARPI